MRIAGILVLCIIVLGLGCARVRVEAPKEAIKLDISMRLDIYQHVSKDIDDIENMVSGVKDKPTSRMSFVREAYAEDSLGPEVEQAAMNRKDRRDELISWEAKGAIGENKSGMVEVRNGDSSLGGIVSAENNDRVVIYRAIARKNGISLEEVGALYAKRLQQDAPAGTPIEALDESSGVVRWRVK
ncbi:MAG: DUF1318 domain-containing protein [Candidatus Omnitrophota bacterium]